MKKIVYILFLIGLLSSCVTNRNSAYLQERDKLPIYEKQAYENYKLKVGDEIKYRVVTMDAEMAKMFTQHSIRGNGNRLVSYRIYDDGTVDLPFMDSVKIAGLTVDEASKKLTEHFCQIIPDSEVRIAMANDRFYVLGKAGASAINMPREKISIFEAVSMAGNIAKFGDRKHVKIIRENEGKIEVKEFDMRSKSILDSEYYYVQANDVIYVNDIKGQFFGIQSYPTAMSVVSSTLSFLLLALSYVL